MSVPSQLQISSECRPPHSRLPDTHVLCGVCVHRAPVTQEHRELQHQLQDVTAAQVSGLAQEVLQVKQRGEAAAVKLKKQAAATQAQVSELRQWFDANQVCGQSLLVVDPWRGKASSLCSTWLGQGTHHALHCLMLSSRCS